MPLFCNKWVVNNVGVVLHDIRPKSERENVCLVWVPSHAQGSNGVCNCVLGGNESNTLAYIGHWQGRLHGRPGVQELEPESLHQCPPPSDIKHHWYQQPRVEHQLFTGHNDATGQAEHPYRQQEQARVKISTRARHPKTIPALIPREPTDVTRRDGITIAILARVKRPRSPCHPRGGLESAEQ